MISSPFILYCGSDKIIKSNWKVYAKSESSSVVLPVPQSRANDSSSEPKVKRQNAPFKLPHGRPIQIVHRLDKGKLQVNRHDLNKILDKVGKNYVAIYAISGPTRSGKSFLLTRCIEYLATPAAESKKKEVKHTGGVTVANPFVWNNQADRLTPGIWIWSEPLKLILPNGKNVYVLLMDCQGCFDDRTSLNEDANIFALSTLLSSVQVFNIKHQIDESVLQFLELFTGIAKRIMITSTKFTDNNFQKLIVLVRDFQLKGYDYGYHSNKGPSERNYEIDKLHPNNSQPPGHKRGRTNIITSYQECGAFLLPHPGKQFTSSDDPQDLDTDYLEEEEKFFRALFDPSNIVVKSINGMQQNGKTLKVHVEKWADEFQNSDVPEVPRAAESFSKLQLYDAIDGEKRKYDSIMKEYLGKSNYQIEVNGLFEKHKSTLNDCLTELSGHILLFGGKEENEIFKKEMEKEAEKLYKTFYYENLSKPKYRWYHMIYYNSGKVALTTVASILSVVSMLMFKS